MPIIRTSQQLQELFRKRKEEKLKQKELLKKARVKEYHQQHREEIREYQRNYRLQHSAELQQKAKVYRDNHREYFREYWRNRQKGIPTKKIDTYQQPPVKTKKQVKELYQKWLQQLQEREPFLTGEQLHWNQLMQNSVQKTLDNMGRNKLTITEIRDKHYAITDSLLQLQEKRKQAKTDDEKNELTRRISKQKASLANFKSRYAHELGLDKDDETKIDFRGSTVKTAMQRLEEKANTLIAQAKTIEEKKKIEEQLYYAKLRYKYACI